MQPIDLITTFVTNEPQRLLRSVLPWWVLPIPGPKGFSHLIAPTMKTKRNNTQKMPLLMAYLVNPEKLDIGIDPWQMPDFDFCCCADRVLMIADFQEMFNRKPKLSSKYFVRFCYPI